MDSSNQESSQRGQDAQIVRAMAGLKESVPFIDDLWSLVSTIRMRLVMLRAKSGVPADGTQHQRLTAFYVGAIEGTIREKFPINLTPAQIGELTFALAMYTARKDDVISGDEQWVAMATEFQQVLGDADNARFAQLGVSYALSKAQAAEAIWTRLEGDLTRAADGGSP